MFLFGHFFPFFSKLVLVKRIEKRFVLDFWSWTLLNINLSSLNMQVAYNFAILLTFSLLAFCNFYFTFVILSLLQTMWTFIMFILICSTWPVELDSNWSQTSNQSQYESRDERLELRRSFLHLLFVFTSMDRRSKELRNAGKPAKRKSISFFFHWILLMLFWYS